MENYSFDLMRIFLGDYSPMIFVEIIFRTVILFSYMIFILRISPQRNIGELSPINILMIIALGSAVGDPMFYPDVPLLHGITVITVVFVINYLLGKIGTHSSAFEMLIQGKPECLIRDGVIDVDTLNAACITHEDLFMALRESQVEKLGQVKRAYIETNGKISIIGFKAPHIIEKSLPVIPPRDLNLVAYLSEHTRVPESGSYVCYNCGNVHHFEENDVVEPCTRCGETQWYDLEKLLTVGED